MYTFKKIFLYIFIILLLLSLYNDFTKDSHSYVVQQTTMITGEPVVSMKFERGDTFLSISEQLNGTHLSNISIEKMIADFEQVNPNVHVHSLKVGKYYNFPIYEKN